MEQVNEYKGPAHNAAFVVRDGKMVRIEKPDGGRWLADLPLSVARAVLSAVPGTWVACAGNYAPTGTWQTFEKLTHPVMGSPDQSASVLDFVRQVYPEYFA